jgi:ribosomal protein S18 acetylase RimI-like enzyme
MSVVRTATASDLDPCAEIAGGKPGKARFAKALSASNGLVLVAEWAGAPVGFLIATLPGATATVADFAVEAPGLWPSVGQHLLREARARLAERAIKQILVQGGDAAKTALLESEGLTQTPEGWWAAAV